MDKRVPLKPIRIRVVCVSIGGCDLRILKAELIPRSTSYAFELGFSILGSYSVAVFGQNKKLGETSGG